MADKATRAVMDVLGCERGLYRFFWDLEVPHPDVCARHTSVWDQERDICEVAEQVAEAALNADAHG